MLHRIILKSICALIMVLSLNCESIVSTDIDFLASRNLVTGGVTTRPGEPHKSVNREEEPVRNEVIDFIFVTDISNRNKDNISIDRLNPRIGALPAELTEMGIDWRMYFMNSDPTGAQSAKSFLMPLALNNIVISGEFLDQNTTNQFHESKINELFIHTLTYGTSPECIENNNSCSSRRPSRPLKTLESFFQEVSTKELLNRGATSLVVVIITNSNEAPDKSTKYRTNATDVQAAATQLIGENRNIHVIGIVPNANDPACINHARNENAGLISHLALKTEGTTVSLCDIQKNSYSSPIISLIERMKAKGLVYN